MLCLSYASSIISHVREQASPLEECRQPHGDAVVKSPPAMQETWVQSLGWEDPLEEEVATHSSILAWEVPWTEKTGRLQSTGLQIVRHDSATKQQDTLIWKAIVCIINWFSNLSVVLSA